MTGRLRSLLLPLLLCVPGCVVTPDAASAPTDRDGDGYDTPADCNDRDADIRPGADEICDGLDNDCNGVVDDHPIDGVPRYADADGDGYGVEPAFLACTDSADAMLMGDCDDRDPSIHPGAIDDDCDGVDDDCDGAEDDDAAEIGFVDADDDGHGDPTRPADTCAPSAVVPNGDDCDDTQSSVSPSAPEVCGNDTDDDCDGTYGEACGLGGTTTAPSELDAEDCESSDRCTAIFLPEDGVPVRMPLAAFDLDRDGTDELLIGDEAAPSGNRGAVFVLWDEPDWTAEGDPTATLTITTADAGSGSAPSDQKKLGRDLVVLDDFTGDGWADLVVKSKEGLWLVSDALEDTGAPAPIAELSAWRVSDGGSTRAVASAGDVTGDGRTDLIGFRGAGRFYLLAGTPDALAGPPHTLSAFLINVEDASGLTGSFGGHDLDGDGFGELVIARPGAVSEAAVDFYNGADLTAAVSTRDTTALETPILLEDDRYEQFGEQVSVSGDLNHDGYADLALSAFDRSTALPVVFLILGSTETFSSGNNAVTADLRAEIVFSSPDTTDARITQLFSAGDLTGDGIDDLTVLHSGSPDGSVADVYAGRGGDLEAEPVASIRGPRGETFQTGTAAVLRQPGAPLLTLTTDAGALYAFPTSGY